MIEVLEEGSVLVLGRVDLSDEIFESAEAELVKVGVSSLVEHGN